MTTRTGQSRISGSAHLIRALVVGAWLVSLLGMQPLAAHADQTTATNLPVAFSVPTGSPCAVGAPTLGPDGTTTAQVTLSGAGTCAITASQSGDATYAPASNVVQSFVIAAAPTTITLGSVATTPYHDAATLTATVQPQSVGGQALTGTVAFAVDGSSVGSAPVNSSGVATITPTVTQPVGSHAVTATFTSSTSNFAGSTTTSSTTLTVIPEDVTVSYAGETTGVYHDAVLLKGLLLEDGTAGAPVSGRTLSLTLGSQSCSGTTGADGVATCTLTLTQHPAAVTAVAAAFAGDTSYSAATSSSVPFTAAKEDTTLTMSALSIAAAGSTPTVAATLTEDGTTPLAGKSVTLTLGSGTTAQSCTGTTTGTGMARCTLPAISQPLGPTPLTAAFAGDADELGATDSSQHTLLFAYLANGAFVIGDTTAQQRLGSTTPVQFWGPRWTQQNTLSGGPAPSPFFGFAKTLSTTPPSCSGTWTTAPGAASLQPPVDPPAYMAVIESSHITKTGATISGTTVGLGIVKTNGTTISSSTLGSGLLVASVCTPKSPVAFSQLQSRRVAWQHASTLVPPAHSALRFHLTSSIPGAAPLRLPFNLVMVSHFRIAPLTPWQAWRHGKNLPVTSSGSGFAGTAPYAHKSFIHTNTSQQQQQILFGSLANRTFGDQPFVITASSVTVSSLPPDPTVIAPVLNRSIATDFTGATAFLYTGDHPIQTGVVPGTIVQTRAAVVRGTVYTVDGNPLAGVTVAVLSHPEFGQTLSRIDGTYDLVINGGGQITLTFSDTGFIGAQRQVQTSWNDYAHVDDVALVRPDPNVTPVMLDGSTTTMQVAQGGMQSDSDGARQETLLFPAGTTATEVLPDGSSKGIGSGHFRATEFTVGSNGPTAMPANLPATSAYTYCVDLSFDEALGDHATSVKFNHPVISYNQDFLGMAAGTSVPVGHYDLNSGQWVADDNGIVVTILSVASGEANLDVNGSGNTATLDQYSKLGIGDAERQQLAKQYAAGTSLWRVAVSHFTFFDFNWGYWGFWGQRAREIQQQRYNNLPESRQFQYNTDYPLHRFVGNGTVDTQKQIFSEDRTVSGTPYLLHYGSDRTPGYTASRTYSIPVSSTTIPSGLKRIDVQVQVAGREFGQTFAPQPNEVYNFTWDGKDVYGRTLQGQQPITVTIVDVYPSEYGIPSGADRAFARYSDVPLKVGRGRGEVAVRQIYTDRVGSWDARPEGLGGWTLSVHHTYDPSNHTLYLGNGQVEGARSVNNVITHFADPASAYRYRYGLAAGSDGSVYIAETGRILKVARDGTESVFAGHDSYLSGCPQQTDNVGDGCLATQAVVSDHPAVALGPDGSVYIADSSLQRVRRVWPNGIITTIAGTGISGYNGDGIPGTQAQLNYPVSVAVSVDGTVYIADAQNHRIRGLGSDGTITTAAGNGSQGYGGDNVPATSVAFAYPVSLAVGADSSLYILDQADGSFADRRIFRVSPAGILTAVTGPDAGLPAEGQPAVSGGLGNPGSEYIAVGPDGTVYFSDVQYNYGCLVREITPGGIERAVAGGRCDSVSGDNGAATAAGMQVPKGVAVGPDGSLYVAERYDAVRRIALPLPGVGSTDILIPSSDGREIYHFDSTGRHVNTLDALTGAVRYVFGYDGAGRLATVADGNGDVTTIEHDPSGAPTDIKAPFGQVTSLTANGDGFLSSITNPLHATAHLGYEAFGLLTSITGPTGKTFTFTYDSEGRLTQTQDPANGSVQLTGTDLGYGRHVTATTSLGRVASYGLTNATSDTSQQQISGTDGSQYTSTAGNDNTLGASWSDGVKSAQSFGPDPRFGVLAPVLSSNTITTPGGLSAQLTNQRSVTQSIAGNPLSLTASTDTLTVNGNSFITRYTASDHTLVTTSPLGRTSTTSVNALRLPVRQQVADLTPVTYQYDSHGFLVARIVGTGSDARTTNYVYGSDGRLQSVTDSLNRATTFTYDAAGHMLSQSVPGEGFTRYEYDLNGNLTGITTPAGRHTTYGFDALDRVSSVTRPDIGTGPVSTQLTYNADRQLQSIALPGGEMVGLTYDGATGKLTSLSGPASAFSYTYDKASGNLIKLASTNGETTAFNYDGPLRTGESLSGPVAGSVATTYDNFFRLSSQSVNSGPSVAYSYDADGLLSGVGPLSINRDSKNGLVTSTALGHISTVPTYNTFGELAGETVGVGGSVLSGTTYTRDSGGRITSKSETIGGVTHGFTYRYNDSGRLMEVKKDGTLIESYTYDADGNRLRGPNLTVDATYNAQGELTTYGDTNYTYTPNGERATKTDGLGLTTYAVDPKDGLLSVTLPNGKTVTYLLDGAGLRVGKSVNGTLTQGFLYDQQGRTVAELDSNGTVLSTFIYAGGTTPVAMIKGGITYRIISDQVGSPRLVIDPTGVIAQQLQYDNFGNVLSDTNPGFQPFGFGGGLYDRDTGLVHLGLRDYDPHTGQWIARDPLGFSAGDTSLYSYSYGDPVNITDPTGAGPALDANSAIIKTERGGVSGWYNSMAAEHPFATGAATLVVGVGIAYVAIPAALGAIGTGGAAAVASEAAGSGAAIASEAAGAGAAVTSEAAGAGAAATSEAAGAGAAATSEAAGAGTAATSEAAGAGAAPVSVPQPWVPPLNPPSGLPRPGSETLINLVKQIASARGRIP